MRKSDIYYKECLIILSDQHSSFTFNSKSAFTIQSRNSIWQQEPQN